MVHHPFAVIGSWLAVCVAGAISSSRLPGLLTTSLAVPGTSSQAANGILARDFGENVEGTFTVVFVNAHRDAATAAHLRARLVDAARALPSARVSALQPGNSTLYGNIATPFGLAKAASLTTPLRSAIAREHLSKTLVTGAPALQADLAGVLRADLHRGELIGAVGALVVLSFALGFSLSVLLPFAMALCSVSASLGLVFLIAHFAIVVLYIPNLVELVGLGLAIDYSLLIVHRFRQELAQGRTSADAIVVTTLRAGRTVALCGAAVAIGLAVLLAVPVPFVRSLGAAGLAVPVASVATALTLPPALLSLLGTRAGRARPGRDRGQSQRGAAPAIPATATATATASPARDRTVPERGWWAAWARLVTAHPLPGAVSALCVLATAAFPVAWLQLTPAAVTALPASMPSAQGLTILRDRVGPGALTPVEIVVDSGHPGAATSPAMDAAVKRLANELLAQRDVFVVAMGNRGEYVDATGRYRRTIAVLRDDFGSGPAQALAVEIGHRLVPGARFPPGSKVYAGGAPVQGEQFLAASYGGLGLVVAAVAGLAYVLLARAFRSLLLPLLAVALGGLSLMASYGFLVVLFRWGVGADLFGLYKVDRLEGWVPLLLFVCLFGLTMDYEVFFVTRMREAFDAGVSGREAIATGLRRTGRVVSAAALTMVATLTGLAAGRVAGLQELGSGLAFGVAVDATVVRGVLMPSLMALCGPWTWSLPRWAARALRVPAPAGI
jgi:RND superfamily putative drug exporter